MSFLNDYSQHKTPNFTIYMHSDGDYGFFEHDEYGDGCGGGLWFEDKELVDYDGVAMLPQEVWFALKELGISWDGEDDY